MKALKNVISIISCLTLTTIMTSCDLGSNSDDSKTVLDTVKVFDTTHVIDTVKVDEVVKVFDTTHIIDTIVAPTLVITETDYTTGWLGLMSASKQYVKGIEIASDAVIREGNGYTYILERTGHDNIIRLDREGILEYQEKIEDGFNPHDVVIFSETVGYICGNSSADIKIFNPTTGLVTGSIDISAYIVENKETPNTSPNATAMSIYNNKLYVALQRRDGWTSGEPSAVLVIDIATDSIEQSIT